MVLSKESQQPLGIASVPITQPPETESQRRPYLRTQPRLSKQALILQLHFVPAAVVSLFSVGLVPSGPERPCHDEGGSGGAREQETRQEITDFGHRRKQRSQARQAAAASAGLVSFRLPKAARRRSAANFARSAAAAMHRLMWRCHPCQERASQWSRPSSFARWKHSSIVQRRPAAPASSARVTPAGASTR